MCVSEALNFNDNCLQHFPNRFKSKIWHFVFNARPMVCVCIAYDISLGLFICFTCF